MAEKDLAEKLLADYNDVFADIVNVLLFDGEERVSPDDLENALVHSMYKADDEKLHEQERDVAKYWKKSNVHIAMLGFENQSSICREMALRVIGYDGAAYRNQLLRCEKGEKIYPVITLVLYFGTEKRWDMPTNLKALLDIPAGLDSYVNDYNIHVCEVAWLPDETIKKFTSDFGIVADFFSQKRKNKGYAPSQKQIKHVDEILKLLTIFSGDKRYGESFELAQTEGKEITTMCDILQSWIDEGVEKGIEQGVEQGELRAYRHSVAALMKGGKSLEDAMETLEIPQKERELLREEFSK
jgi:hypothetical protein